VGIEEQHAQCTCPWLRTCAVITICLYWMLLSHWCLRLGACICVFPLALTTVQPHTYTLIVVWNSQEYKWASESIEIYMNWELSKSYSVCIACCLYTGTHCTCTACPIRSIVDIKYYKLLILPVTVPHSVNSMEVLG